MKILSREQIRAADAYTLAHEPISGLELMDRAAGKCAEWISEHYSPVKNIIIVCGTGNNGGDGLSIASQLEKKINASIYIVRHSDKASEDFTSQLKKCPVGIKRVEVSAVSQFAIEAKPSTLLIDALFGSGLNKPVEGLAAEVIGRMNSSGLPVISIDIPSGMFCDTVPAPGQKNIVKAAHTLTFQTPKLSFLFSESGEYTGAFTVLDIGLDKKFIGSQQSKDHYITAEDVKEIYLPRKKFSHKGTYGHALLAAGSYGKTGAAILAAKACLHTGAGLTTVHVPRCGIAPLQAAVPEAMCRPDEHEYHITSGVDVEKHNAIGIGPGIGTDKQTANVLKLLIQNSKLPLVLDADALNILSENRTWLSFLPKGSILTPHPKEFERLTEKTSGSAERVKLLREFSFRHSVYVVLKGAHTAIACPDGNVWFNSTGNPGMAKGGSGDALTGIITSLLAQHYSPPDACILGVYLHGLAGDIAASQFSQEAMTAMDLIECIGEAWKMLE